MIISEDLQNKALKLGRKFRVSKIWVNASGECFTEEQFAKSSVKGDKDKYSSVEITADVVPAKATVIPVVESKNDTKFTNDLGTVVEVVSAIEACDNAEAVQAILDAEMAGSNRKTIIAAANKKLNGFNKQ